jgi:hypothetical protein
MRRLFLATSTSCLALSFLLAGCGEPSPSAKNVQQKVGEAWDAMKVWGAEKKDELVKKTSDGLASLEPALADAKKAAASAGGEAAQALDGAWAATKEKLEALKGASGEGFAKARDELLQAYEALRTKLGR